MKTTLVAVSGMSPAIITETLWALASEAPYIVPDDVVIITTSKGESDIREMLLTIMDAWGGQKVWERLRTDIFAKTKMPKGSGKLQLSIRVIELPDEQSGIRRPADDLRTRSDNDCAADFIIQTLAPICDAEDNHVIASIAGGRKTMGALLYAAMSLLGKESDRVTHVLVSEPFESVRGFFYPDQPLMELESRPFGQPAVAVCASSAKVEMADIPFVPLRNKFSELNEPRRTFSGLVDSYSRHSIRLPAGKPRVSIDKESGVMIVESKTLRLTGRTLVVVFFLVDRAQAGHPAFASLTEAEGDFLTYAKRWKSDYSFHAKTARYFTSTPSVQDITKALSDLRTKLTKAGAGHCITDLAPDRGRIGFEIVVSGN
jgi:CRISPR-associated protein (TIGR02584 family)